MNIQKTRIIKSFIELKSEESQITYLNLESISLISHYGSLYYSEEELSYILIGTGYELIELHALDELNSDSIKEGQVNQILIDIDFINNFIVKSKVKKGKFKKSL